MYAPHREPVNGPHFPWYVAIDLPGAGQLRYLRQLIEARPMFERIPDQSLITDALSASDRIQATRGKDYILVYSTQGRKFTVNLNKIAARDLVANWYNRGTANIRMQENSPVRPSRNLLRQPPDTDTIGFLSLTNHDLNDFRKTMIRIPSLQIIVHQKIIVLNHSPSQ
jgi:hypothetical protein